MTDADPRDSDGEYQRSLPGPLRERVGRDTDGGEVTRFVVQLEYHHDGTWQTVVRYDHRPGSEFGHDIEEEGLHIDIYRDGETYRSEFVTSPLPAAVALDHAEDNLPKNLERFIEGFDTVGYRPVTDFDTPGCRKSSRSYRQQYEQWHGTRNR